MLGFLVRLSYSDLFSRKGQQPTGCACALRFATVGKWVALGAASPPLPTGGGVPPPRLAFGLPFAPPVEGKPSPALCAAPPPKWFGRKWRFAAVGNAKRYPRSRFSFLFLRKA